MTPAAAIFPWLEDWKLAVQGWSRDGSLARAAQEALNLDAVPLALQSLIGQWADAQWDELPPIELLTSEAIPDAADAYAVSTGTIYLNQSWLESASAKQVQAVLTEELGHHLDGVLNAEDTAGDEGDLFAQLLLGGTEIEQDQSNDQLQLRVKDQLITAEAAETDSSGNNTEQAISLLAASPTLIYQGIDQSLKINNPLPVLTGNAQPASQVNIFLTALFWRQLTLMKEDLGLLLQMSPWQTAFMSIAF